MMRTTQVSLNILKFYVLTVIVIGIANNYFPSINNGLEAIIDKVQSIKFWSAKY